MFILLIQRMFVYSFLTRGSYKDVSTWNISWRVYKKLFHKREMSIWRRPSTFFRSYVLFQL